MLSLLGNPLPLVAGDYTGTTEDKLKVLLGTAANIVTLETVCTNRVDSPDPETVQPYFNQPPRVKAMPVLAERLSVALEAKTILSQQAN